jgi:hypothetical protein
MSSARRWSETERAHLAAFYPAISAQKLTEILPDRTPKAIKAQAIHLGIGKCHERLREMGRTNVRKRWDGRGAFRDGEIQA